MTWHVFNKNSRTRCLSGNVLSSAFEHRCLDKISLKTICVIYLGNLTLHHKQQNNALLLRVEYINIDNFGTYLGRVGLVLEKKEICSHVQTHP